MNERINEKNYIARFKAYKCMLNLALSQELNLKTKPISKRKRSGLESVRSVRLLSIEKSVVKKT